MKVSKIKAVKQDTASPEEDILSVSKKMKLNKSIVVLEKKKPVGIITMRDIVARVLSKGKDPKKTLAKEIMTTPVFCVKENEEIENIMKTMIEKDYLTVPVIDKKGYYKGIITLRQMIGLIKKK
ncbi:MAG: CBS domain-containing protein [Candidatus Aenigmarchaeota archaeon]|nr:CBS domain-containing protein [Candidatus Aenigmarchaeota archaeon]MBU5689009.1 CBS domain-containing protein [Candidatus Aenigmarchaeota archaeon]